MILRWYILRELLAGILLAFISLTAILFLMNLLGPMRAFAVMSLSFLARSAPAILLYTMPMTLLVGVVVGMTLGYGRLAGDNEIDAMRVSGVSLRRILAPAMAAGAAASILAFVIYWDAVPYAGRVQRSLRDDALLEMLKSPPPGPQQFWLGSMMRMSYREVKEGTFKDFRIVVYSSVDHGASEIHSAREARLVAGETAAVEMRDYRTLRFDSQGQRLPEQTAAEGRFQLPISGKVDDVPRPKYAGGARLLRMMNEGAFREDAAFEFHSRVAGSLTPLVLALMAALIGIQVRRSSRLAGLGASLPPLFLYMILALPLEQLALGGSLDPRLAAYLPVGLMLTADAALYWRMAR